MVVEKERPVGRDPLLLLVAAGLLCVGLSPSLPVSFVGVFLIGAGTTWIRVLLQTVQQMATDPQYHGRMASYRMLCNQSAVAIGGPILGWIASHCGVESSYLALLLPVQGQPCSRCSNARPQA